MRRLPFLLALAALVVGLAAAPRHLISRSATSPDFTHFESAHVHPAVLTPAGTRLLVVNTPDNRLSVFDVTGVAPVKVADIPVGLEPVSVACRDDSTAWVVNNVSDDVSIVNLNTLHTKATLRVGDEPNDVVFAGNPLRAYVSVSQEDVVKVYDPNTPTTPLNVIAIAGRMPRALAKNPAGTLVYVAVLQAGNRTSVLSAAEAGDSLPAPNPPMAGGLPPAPKVGLVIQKQGPDWRDETGRLWNNRAKYDISDVDVAEISTASNSVTRTFGDIGTVNFGLAVNPLDDRIAVAATEARNLKRFEPNLRGHLVDTRLGIIAAAGTVALDDLNPHIDYSVTPGPQAERDSAIGIPNAVAWSGNGQRVYVTSLASNRIAVVAPAAAVPVIARRPTVAGPTGVVVDDARGRIYVVGRFRNQLQTLSSANFSQVAVTSIGFDPSPDDVVNGRKFFYGGFTSGHGEEACATCHVSGDFDNIAWDLGNPQGTYQPKPPNQVDPTLQGFHPMKGPMTTQSLRGLPNTALLHWRGDRADLNAFNGAFVSLMGRTAQLPDSEMAAFSAFVLPLVYPPNPNEFLDRTVPNAPPGTPSALRGQTFFFNNPVDGTLRCNDCHAGTNFGPGTNGQVIDHNALLESQDFKIPQLRNLYKKTGFKDTTATTWVNKRGFGFTHDGAVDNVFDFLKFPGFNFGSDPVAANATRRDLEAFLHAFDTGIAPAVGYQLTFFGANDNDAVAIARLDTLVGQADANVCDLVAKGRLSGLPRGWIYQGGGTWKSDKAAEPTLTTPQLRALGGAGSEVTITGVPKGSGQRCGIDRDRDSYLDADELIAGSNPGDPASTPLNVGVAPGGRVEEGLRSIGPNPFRAAMEIRFALARRGPIDLVIYDVMGREVRTLARGQWLEAGPQSLRWDGVKHDGAPAAAGVYFVRLSTGTGHWTRTVVRIR